MTMHIFFNQDKDGYKKDQSCYVERTLARRFCDEGIAIPYQTHLDDIYETEQAEKAAKQAEKKKKVTVTPVKKEKSKKVEKVVKK